MIRMNLLKARSSPAGGWASLATPRDGMFIAKREVALGGLFLLAGALILYSQLGDGDLSQAAGSERQAEGVSNITEGERAAVESAGPIEEPQAPAIETDGQAQFEIAASGEAPTANDAPAEGFDRQISETVSAREPSLAVDQPPPATIAPISAEGGDLTQLVVSVESGPLRIFALTGKQPQYSSFRLEDPRRVVVDMKGVRVSLPRGQRRQSVSHSQVEQIRVAQFRNEPPVARLVLDVEAYPEIEFLPQFNGLYLVVSRKDQ